MRNKAPLRLVIDWKGSPEAFGGLRANERRMSMTEEKPKTDEKWSPEFDEDALKSIIRATVMNAGPLKPDELPSKVRERIKGRATGDLDVDAYIKQILRETQAKDDR